jgi:hypothetical protein
MNTPTLEIYIALPYGLVIYKVAKSNALKDVLQDLEVLLASLSKKFKNIYLNLPSSYGQGFRLILS